MDGSREETGKGRRRSQAPPRATFADYVLLSPMRKPSWRYDRALDAIDGIGGQPRRNLSRRFDEPMTLRLRDFLKAYRKSADLSYRERVYGDFPLFYLAYELETAGENLKHIVQARILAKQTDLEIAGRVNTCPEMIDLYEKCFFNVRDRLDRPDWIFQQVYGKEAMHQTAVAGAHQHVMIKLFAYFAGPSLVEFMYSGFSGVHHVSSPQEMQDLLDQYMTSTIRRRAAQNANTFVVNPSNIMQLLELHTKIVEIERVAARDGKPQDLVEQVIDEFVAKNPWVTGANAVAKLGEIVRYDESASEARDEDLHRAARGEIIDVASPAYSDIVDAKGRPIQISPIFEARKHTNDDPSAPPPVPGKGSKSKPDPDRDAGGDARTDGDGEGG
jgi:hypothetical protein